MRVQRGLFISCITLTSILFLVLFYCGNVLAVAPIDVEIGVKGTGGTTGGPLTINRVELTFDNGRGDITVALNDLIKARAYINYTGNGVLSYKWLVDGRVIQEGSRTLIYGTDIIIEADDIPPFPTFEPGLHTVTFQITNPVVSFTIPSITYNVDISLRINRVSEITLYYPDDEAHMYRHELSFSWNDPSNIGTYKVVIKNQNNEEVYSAVTNEFSYDIQTVTKTGVVPLEEEQDYTWQVFAIGPRGIILGESEIRSFHIKHFPVEDYLKLLTLKVSAEPLLQPEYGHINRVEGTPPLPDMSFISEVNFSALIAGQTFYLTPVIYNLTLTRQSGYVVRILEDGEEINRIMVPDINPEEFVAVTIPWRVPVNRKTGLIQVQLIQSDLVRDTQEEQWTSTTDYYLNNLDFIEQQSLQIPPTTLEGFVELGCEEWAENIDPSKLSARVVSLINRSHNNEEQRMINNGFFTVSRDERVVFKGVVTDKGVFSDYNSQYEHCRDWAGRGELETINDFQTTFDKLNSCLQNRNRNLGDVVSQGLSEQIIQLNSDLNLQLDVNTLRPSQTQTIDTQHGTYRTTVPNEGVQLNQQNNILPGSNMLPNGGGNNRQLPSGKEFYKRPINIFDENRLIAFAGDETMLIALNGAGGFNCAEAEDIAEEILANKIEQVNAAHERAEFLRNNPPSGYPAKFFVYRVNEDDSVEKVWESDIFLVYENDVNREVLSSPEWQAPEVGKYLVTIENYEPAAVLYATFSGGLPKYLRMAGFDLEVIRYTEGKDVKSALSGRAKLTWKGNEGEEGIIVDFKDVHIEPYGDPLHAKVTGGIAHLPEGASPVFMKLQGYSLMLTSLTLTAFTAKADFSFIYPFTGIKTIDRINNHTILIRDVTIYNGGEFVATAEFPDNFPYVHPPLQGIRSSFLFPNEEITLKLSGGLLLLDFSPHLGYSSYSRDGSWQGIRLIDGIVRVLVRAHNDTVETPVDDALYGLFDTVNTSYLYGRFALLDLLPDGVVEGNASVISAAEAGLSTSSLDKSPSRFAEAESRMELVSPSGFSLEIDSGTFELTRYGVGGINLGGVLFLPEQYEANPIRFSRLRRRTMEVDGTNYGFKIEEFDGELPAFRMDAYIYRPQNAHLIIPGGSSLGQLRLSSDPSVVLLVPEKVGDVTWLASAIGESFSGRPGLHLRGGLMEFPWKESEPCQDLSGVRTERGRLIAVQCRTEDGAFLLDSSGVTGIWALFNDLSMRNIRGFNGKIKGLYIYFEESSLTKSGIKGRLIIPYPANIAIDFRGSVTSEGELVVSEDGLEIPEDGWLLEYWQMRVVPNTVSALFFDDGRLVLRDWSMALEVSDEFGGIEFVALGSEYPFSITLDIFSNGDIGYNGKKYTTGNADTMPSITPAENLRFLGISFQPDQDKIQIMPYIGDHRPPSAETPPTSEPLVQFEGYLSFTLFGTRKVKIAHTAMGARVPFIDGRPIPFSDAQDTEFSLADSGGILRIYARLKFKNTYGLSEQIINKRLQNSADSQYYDQQKEEYSPFKAFIGEGKIEILHAFQVNGLAEAGQFQEEGQYMNYEKIGVGMGVDIIKATLAGLHGAKTSAKLAGAVVEITTGARGLGADVIHVATDAAAFASSVATTVASAVAAAGTAGGASGVTAEEIRALVGDGLNLTDSSLNLIKAIYIQQRNAKTTDPAYVGLEIADIIVRAINMGVTFEEIDERKVAQIILQTLDTAIPLLKTMEIRPQENDEKVDLGLDIAHIPIIAARSLVEKDSIDEHTAWMLVDKTLNVVGEISEITEFQEYSDEITLALALAKAAVDVGKQVQQQGQMELQNVIQLMDELLNLLCNEHRLVSNVIGFSNQFKVKRALAVSKLILNEVNNNQDEPIDVIKNIIGKLINGQMNYVCGDVTNLGPSEVKLKEILRLVKHLLDGIETISSDALERMKWAVGTINQVVNTIKALDENMIAENLSNLVNAIYRATEQLTNDMDPAEQVLRIVDALLITDEFRQLITQTAPATVAELIDVSKTFLHNGIALMDENFDRNILIEGLANTIDEIQDLPQNLLENQIRQALSIIKEILNFIKLNTEGQSNEIANLLKVQNVLEILSQIAPDINLSSSVQNAINIASALVKTMVDTVIHGGKTGIETVSTLLENVVLSSSTESYALEGKIGAVLRALPWAWSPVDADLAYKSALQQLLDTEDANTNDPVIKSAIARARLALMMEPGKRVGRTIKRDSSNKIIEIREVTPEGVERILMLEYGLFMRKYPEEHPDHHGGLEELYSFDRNFTEDEILHKSLEEISSELNLNDSNLLKRKYKDENGNTITYSNNTGEKLVFVKLSEWCIRNNPQWLLSVDSIPAEGTPAENIEGNILEALWCKQVGDLKGEVSYIQGSGALKIEFPWIGKAEIRAINTEQEPFSSKESIYNNAMANRIIMYRGPAIINNVEYTIEYTEGTGGIIIKSEENYDLIKAPGNLQINSINEIENILSSPELLERYRVTPSGSWLYSIQDGIALHEFSDGTWELFRLGSLDNISIPDPDGEIPVGELIVQKGTDGRIVNVSGEPTLPGWVQISSEDGVDVIKTGSGRVMATIHGTSLQLNSLSGVVVTETRTENLNEKNWVDSEGSHNVRVEEDSLGREIKTETIVRPDSTIEEQIQYNDENIIKITITADGKKIVQINNWQSKIVDLNTPYFSYSNVVPQIETPSEDDPNREVKLLFIDLAQKTMDEVLRNPSIDGIRKIISLLIRYQEKKILIKGFSENLLETISRVQTVIMEKKFKELEELSEDPEKVIEWFDYIRRKNRGEVSPDERPPDLAVNLSDIMQIWAIGQSFGLQENTELIKQNMTVAFYKMYLILKKNYELNQNMNSAAYLMIIAATVQTGIVNEEAFPGLGGDIGINETCEVVNLEIQELNNRVNDPKSVFTDDDLEYAASIGALAQTMNCTISDIDMTEMLQAINSSILEDIKRSGIFSPEVLASLIRRYGEAGKAMVFSRLSSVIENIGLPTNEEEFLKLSRLYRTIEKLEQVSYDSQNIDDSMDSLFLSEYSTDISSLKDFLKERITQKWNQKTTELLQDMGIADIRNEDFLRSVVEHVSLGEELMQRIPELQLNTNEIKQRVLEIISQEYEQKIQQYIEAFKNLLASNENVDNVDTTLENMLEEIKSFERVSYKLSQAWTDIDIPTADTIFKQMIENDLQRITQDEDVFSILWHWGYILDRFNATESKKTLREGLEGIISTIAQRAQSGEIPWDEAMTQILEIMAKANTLGWDFAGLSVGEESMRSILKDLLVIAYQEAKTELETNIDAPWNVLKQSIGKVLNVEALQNAMGINIYEDPRIQENSFSDVLAYISQNLLERVNRIATCIPDRCTKANLKEITEISAFGEAFGLPQKESITEAYFDVLGAYQSGGKPITPETILGSWDMIERMVKRDNPSRERVKELLEGIVNVLDPSDEQMEQTLSELYTKTEDLMEMPVGYQIQQPDPLEGVITAIEEKYNQWIGADIENKETELLTSSNGDDWEDDFRVIDEMLDKSQILRQTVANRLEDGIEEFIETGPEDRYRRVARILEPVVDRAGADLKLAYHLTSRLTPPSISGEFVFRTSYTGELAVFLLDGTNLQFPDVIGDPQEFITWLLTLSSPEGANIKIQILDKLKSIMNSLPSGNELIDIGVNFVVSIIDSIENGMQLDIDELFGNLGNNLKSSSNIWLNFIGDGISLNVSDVNNLASSIFEGMSKLLNAEQIVAAFNNLPQEIKIIRKVLADFGENASNEINQGRETISAVVNTIVNILFDDFPFAKELTTWTFNISGIFDDNDNVEDILDRLASSNGLPELACIVNSHIDGLDISPLVMYMPAIVGKAVLAAGTGSDGAVANAAIDTFADMTNALFAANNISCEVRPIKLPENDNALASLIRQLKNPETIDNGIKLVAMFAIKAVETIEQVTGYREHTFSNIMKIIWWGNKNQPLYGQGSGFYDILSKGLRGSLSSEDLLFIALRMPNITNKIAEELYSDPNLKGFMNILAGTCNDDMLLPPDRCVLNDQVPLPNMLLYVLDNIRFKILEDELGSNWENDRIKHGNDETWGYLKTLPVMNFSNGKIPDLSEIDNIQKWNEFVETVSDLETNIENIKKAAVAVIDLSRMAVNLIASLPTENEARDAANTVLSQSVFAEQIGGDTFSGIAGGLIKTWAVGEDPDNAELYFELIGQFAVPLLVKTAAQLSYTSFDNGGWAFKIRAGGDFPNVDFLCNTIKIKGCSGQNIAETIAAWHATAYLAGWLGQDSNQALYAQLYTKAEVGYGPYSAGSIELSGFAENLQNIRDINFGVCINDVRMPNPFVMLFTMIGSGVEPTGGGYVYKTNSAGFGFKVGVDYTLSFPMLPVVSFTMRGDIGAAFDINGEVEISPETMKLGNPLSGVSISGGPGFNLSYTGNIFTYKITDNVDVQMNIYNLQNFGNPNAEYGLKFKFGNFAWMVFTNKKVYVGEGQFPNKGEKRNYISIDVTKLFDEGDPLEVAENLAELASGVYDAGKEKREVGDWGGWDTNKVYDLFSEDMCGVKEQMSTGKTIRPNPLEGR